MSQQVCHYCQKSDFDIEIRGKTLMNDEKLIDYRICQQCSNILAKCNPNQDKNKRQSFLDKVRSNAIESVK